MDDDCDGDIDCDDSDCNAYGCLVPPPGGVFAAVVLGPGLCNLALETQMRGCGKCTCDVDDTGSCGHAIELYDNSGCSGNPLASELVVGTGCTTVQTTVVSPNSIWAISHATGLDDAQCSPAQVTASSDDRTVCTSGGSCSGGGTCVPAGQSLPCVLFDGEVDCPNPGDAKTTLFSGGTDTCDCACTSGRQDCPTNEHFHAYENDSCGSTKTDVDGDDVCVDTTQLTVLSVNNHAGDIPAVSAQCHNNSQPQGSPTPMTLCCP